MSASEPDFRYQADMGFTRVELLKGLANAVLPYTVSVSGKDPIEILHEGRLVTLTTGPDGYRAIASMRIPLLPVKLEFFGFDQHQYEAFLARFRKYLHKGGG